jgi:hypothetical protein
MNSTPKDQKIHPRTMRSNCTTRFSPMWMKMAEDAIWGSVQPIFRTVPGFLGSMPAQAGLEKATLLLAGPSVKGQNPCDRPDGTLVIGEAHDLERTPSPTRSARVDSLNPGTNPGRSACRSRRAICDHAARRTQGCRVVPRFLFGKSNHDSTTFFRLNGGIQLASGEADGNIVAGRNLIR